MGPAGKFTLGAIATVALSSIFHGPLGFGTSFIGTLGAQASAAVAGDAAVHVAMASDPYFERGALLSGPHNGPEADRLLASVRAIPGMAWAKWVDNGNDKAVAATPPPATAAAVKACQDDVDATIKGKTIEFASGGSTVDEKSIALIDALASQLKECAGTTVEIAGHTDATGIPAKNLALSEQRAASVTKALVDRGVPAERLVPHGYGQTKPLVAGADANANARNRRIELHISSAATASGSDTSATAIAAGNSMGAQ